MTEPRRFQDGPGGDLSDWALEDVLVVCPSCGERAVVRAVDDARFGARRLVCPSCALHRESGADTQWGGPVDPWFRCELYLRAEFRGHVLWAFNAHHAAHLRDYVAAQLRERKPGPFAACRCGDLRLSMVERLPRWMKDAHNREPLVALLDDFLARAAA